MVGGLERRVGILPTYRVAGARSSSSSHLPTSCMSVPADTRCAVAAAVGTDLLEVTTRESLARSVHLLLLTGAAGYSTEV